MTPFTFSLAPVSEDPDMLPPGMLAHFAGATPPAGWLVCDGADYAVAAYPALAAYLAGVWDTFRAAAPAGGRFRVPRANGLALIAVGALIASGTKTSARALADLLGEEEHQITTAEMPTHTHTVTDPGHTHSCPVHDSAVPPGTGWQVGTPGTPDPGSAGLTANTTGITLGNAGLGGSANVMQPSFAALLCIKT